MFSADRDPIRSGLALVLAALAAEVAVYIATGDR